MIIHISCPKCGETKIKWDKYPMVLKCTTCSFTFGLDSANVEKDRNGKTNG